MTLGVMSCMSFNSLLFCPHRAAKRLQQPRHVSCFLGLYFGLLVCLILTVTQWFCLRGRRLEFLHIPKNAGTSVEAAGLASNIYWGAFELSLMGNVVMPDGSKCSAYHAPPSAAPGINTYDRTKVFCITRHPYDRAVSEYKYLLSDDAYWSDFYAAVFDNGLYDYPACTKEGLNHFITNVMIKYKQGQRYIDDCHHVSQTEYIWAHDGSQLCTNIVRTDDLPDKFDALMISHGYGVRMGNPVNAADPCDVSANSLTPQTRLLLNEVYEDDFRLLNYSKY